MGGRSCRPSCFFPLDWTRLALHPSCLSPSTCVGRPEIDPSGRIAALTCAWGACISALAFGMGERPAFGGRGSLGSVLYRIRGVGNQAGSSGRELVAQTDPPGDGGDRRRDLGWLPSAGEGRQGGRGAEESGRRPVKGGESGRVASPQWDRSILRIQGSYTIRPFDV